MLEITSLIQEYGAWVVFGWILIDRLGVPIPSLPALIVGGALAANGQGEFFTLVGASLLACLVGDGAWYFAGRRFGGRVLRGLCRISLSPDSCIRQSETRFGRSGSLLLLVAKFIPGLATMAAPVAGAVRIRPTQFFVFGGIGSLIWCLVGLGLGMLFHAQIDLIIGELGHLGGIALPVIGAVVAGYILLKWYQRRRLYRTLRMARIGVDELRSLMSTPEQLVVIDMRSSVARKVDPRAIPGALALDAEHLTEHARLLPKDRDIVLYCSCPNEASAAYAAKKLIDLGYSRVRPLHGGLDAWIAAGHAIEPLFFEEGADRERQVASA